MPNSCPICEKSIKWDKLICEDCLNQFVMADNENREGLVCDHFFSAFSYEGVCVKAIYALKEDYVYNFAEYTSYIIADELVKSGVADKTDIVTAVPMSRKKRFVRGYDQAEVMANFVCKILGKPKDYKLLKRLDDKILQRSLTAEERKKHADSIYVINDRHKDISGKRVIICDDVITTGSTMNRCTALLKEMGAKEVCCVSLASTILQKQEYSDKD